MCNPPTTTFTGRPLADAIFAEVPQGGHAACRMPIVPGLRRQLARSPMREQIELLELDASGIHFAEYLTSLPPQEVLQAKLHEAIARSRARLESRGEDA